MVQFILYPEKLTALGLEELKSKLLKDPLNPENPN